MEPALASSTPRPTGGGSHVINASYNNAFAAAIHNYNRPSDDENSSLASGADSLGAGGSLGGNGHPAGPYHRNAHSASPTHKPLGPQPPFPGNPSHAVDYFGESMSGHEVSLLTFMFHF